MLPFGRLISCFTTIALVAGLTVIPRAPVAISSTAPRDTVSQPLPPLLPPPRMKPAPKSPSGRVDLPYDFQAGTIRLRVAPGHDINQLMAKYNLPGPAAYWNTPPFDASDQRAGLDRAFSVGVPEGREKEFVQRLAPMTADFEYVQLKWKIPVHVGPSAATSASMSADAGVMLSPNDPLYTGGYQGNLISINMPRAWDRTVSWDGIVVAVIDSGLRASHEDAGTWKQKTGWNFFTGTSIPAGTATDTGCASGHGTHVTTIAAADTNNSKGVAGAGFNSGIMPLKYIAADCVTVADVSRADPIRWAKDNGALVINMSYWFAVFDTEEAAALSEAWAAGVVPVGAAGNDGVTTETYPCGNIYILCVGASDNSGARWSGSNYGRDWVDFAAPGIGIWGAGSASNTTYINGTATSYAAPQVTGIAALLRSIGRSPNEQYAALCNTARANDWTYCGLVDAGAALWY